MNQGTRRESENVPHRFFIRNAYLFEMDQQHSAGRVLAARQTFALGGGVTLERRWN
jgi:hypothetical protein